MMYNYNLAILFREFKELYALAYRLKAILMLLLIIRNYLGNIK